MPWRLQDRQWRNWRCHGAPNIALEIAEGSRMETDKVAEVPLQLRLSRFCFPFFASSAGCLVVAVGPDVWPRAVFRCQGIRMQRSKVTLSCTWQIPLTNFVSAIGWWLQLSTCSLNFGMMIPSDTGFQIGWKQNQAKYGGVIINQRNLTTKYVEFSSRNRNLPMTCLSVEHGFMDLFFISRGGWATITDWCWRVGSTIWRWFLGWRRHCLDQMICWLIFFVYPLVNIQKAIENGHRNSGFSHK